MWGLAFITLCRLLLLLHAEVVLGDVQPIGSHEKHQQPLFSEIRPKRVAIIGAGSAGTSTAYYLRNASLHAGIPLDITIYERNDYIGGRSTTVPAFNDPSQPVELGASIFVSVNKNLVNAVEAFNLSTASGLSSRSKEDSLNTEDDEDVDKLLGIWDGTKIVFTQPTSSSSIPFIGWWHRARLLWRYGTAPYYALKLMRQVVGRFLRLYDAPYFPFVSLSAAARDAGLTETTAISGWRYLRENGLAGKFAWEIVQSLTRVNYAANIRNIHGLETMVCLATDGAMSVKGGNWRIFSSMAQEAGAQVRLGTEVLRVAKNDRGDFTIASRKVASIWGEIDRDADEGEEETQETFDEVVLAAPFHQANITFTTPLAHEPADDEYVNLHVTLFSSTNRILGRAFRLGDGEAVPDSILTTLPAAEMLLDQESGRSWPSSNGSGIWFSHHSLPSGRAFYSHDELAALSNQETPTNPPSWLTSHLSTSTPPADGPNFFSISTLRRATNPHKKRPEYIYKIFSPERASAFDIAAVVGADPRPDGSLPPEIGWVYRKEWRSYPVLEPRTQFEPLRLDCEVEDVACVRNAGGLWYTAGIEGFISTMETSSLMGANVAALIAEAWARP